LRSPSKKKENKIVEKLSNSKGTSKKVLGAERKERRVFSGVFAISRYKFP
jgi:hypothetical protein